MSISPDELAEDDRRTAVGPVSAQKGSPAFNFAPGSMVADRYRVVSLLGRGGMGEVGGKTPGGRFCNVFKFRDGRISSLHIYLDPDYTGEDEARFRWGKDRQW